MRLPTQLLHRKLNCNKGDFGHIFAIAGSFRFSGAAVLCSYAALRSGAGLVTLAAPSIICRKILSIKPPELMLLPLKETPEGALSITAYKKIIQFLNKPVIIALGPGLSQNKGTQLLVQKIVLNSKHPMVIDADGLNALCGHLKLFGCNDKIVITPHPGEMARLLGQKVEEIEADRKHIAVSFSRKHNVTVVLKGYRTVVADKLGNVYLNKTGNAGMATAGSGDVLTGIIASFLGQGLNTFEAAKYAVYLHGLAGDLAAVEKTQLCLIASDIIDKLPEAIKQCS